MVMVMVMVRGHTVNEYLYLDPLLRSSVVGGLSWTFLHDELLYKYCSDCLELAEDPPAIEVIYLHKHFQIFLSIQIK